MSEELLPSSKNVVQRIDEVRGRLGNLESDLVYVLPVGLLDLIREVLLEGTPRKS
jgi:hypothetical protein